MTRIIDIFLSIVGIILFLPFLPILAFFIKVDSRGPIFYACKRVGQHGKIFNMYKLRTMFETPVELGPALSPQGDPRGTPVGRVLRRLKLNEFPQLFNVLKGDMTMVGPRPEALELAALYPEEAKIIFTVKPGLAGPNQILGRNEEELYPPGADPVQFYIEHILPMKIPLDVQYIMDKSLVKNLKYLYLAVKVTVTGAISRQHLVNHRSQIYLMLADIAACLLSFSLAHLLRYENLHGGDALQAFLVLLPLVVLARIPVFICFGFYQTLIRHLSIFDIKRIFKGVALSSIILVTISFLGGFIMTTKPTVSSYSRSVFLIDWFSLTILLVGMRALLKKIYLRYSSADDSKAARMVLIWGAGDAGELCLHYLKRNRQPTYTIAGFIDDDPRKRGKQIDGYKILGNRHHLKTLAQLYKIQEVLVAIASATSDELQQIITACQQLGLEAQLFQFRTTIAYSRIPQESEQPAICREGLVLGEWIPSPHRPSR
jgi:lipopolysaccharide/colanic/teichoic acid biosynthesis glycosyltransferase